MSLQIERARGKTYKMFFAGDFHIREAKQEVGKVQRACVCVSSRHLRFSSLAKQPVALKRLQLDVSFALFTFCSAKMVDSRITLIVPCLLPICAT